MPKIEVNDSLCKGCYLCVQYCPKKCLKKSENFSKTGYFPAQMADESACIGCAMCYQICPDLAITVLK